MEDGDIVVAEFNLGEYLEFINFCFLNGLISGIDLRFKGEDKRVLFLRIDAPGIDRIDRAIVKFGGSRVL